jgi:hypothetical protein
MDVIQHNNNHNHIPDNSDIKARKTLVDMKKLATESQISTQNTIAKCIENVEQSVALKLPAIIFFCLNAFQNISFFSETIFSKY